jgi:hypothetical protein
MKQLLRNWEGERRDLRLDVATSLCHRCCCWMEIIGLHLSVVPLNFLRKFAPSVTDGLIVWLQQAENYL